MRPSAWMPSSKDLSLSHARANALLLWTTFSDRWVGHSLGRGRFVDGCKAPLSSYAMRRVNRSRIIL